MSVLRLLMSFFGFKISPKKVMLPKSPMLPKDPMDWRLTENSTCWEADQYCPRCKKSTWYDEQLSRICNGCGFNGSMTGYRSSRKIWDGQKWVLQIKYGNGPNEYIIQ